MTRDYGSGSSTARFGDSEFLVFFNRLLGLCFAFVIVRLAPSPIKQKRVYQHVVFVWSCTNAPGLFFGCEHGSPSCIQVPRGTLSIFSALPHFQILMFVPLSVCILCCSMAERCATYAYTRRSGTEDLAPLACLLVFMALTVSAVCALSNIMSSWFQYEALK